MFDSGITAKSLIDGIIAEADIALSIQPPVYIDWLNATEQLLYTEVIKEQKSIELTYSTDEIAMSALAVQGENSKRFEDVYAVFADSTQLIKSTLTSGVIFKDTYYKKVDQPDDKIGLNLSKTPENIKIIYFVKPELKTISNYASKYVMLPIEFIDLIKAKLRGEAYKYANEDNLAAKWLNDYNVLVETFKAWLSNKQPEFGI